MTALRDLLALYRRERGGSLAETVEGVRTLSAMFSGVTPHRPGYLASRSLRRAYVHYYLPVNAQKVARVLAELDTYAPFSRPPRVLDFGCGPGSASIALLLALPARRSLGEGGSEGRKARAEGLRCQAADLTFVDVVDEALDDASFFARAFGVEPRLAHEPPAEKFDLILAADVLSEASVPLEDLLSDSGHLVVIEPAHRAAARRLMERRDRLVERGFRIAAPCLGATRCPMLEHADQRCHQEAPWDRPASVAQVDRRLGLPHGTLQYSYLVVTKQGRVRADVAGDFRVVSDLHREKGKAWAWLCGRRGPLCRAEVLTRHRSADTADFFHARRGDVLALDAAGPSARVEGRVEKISGASGI